MEDVSRAAKAIGKRDFSEKNCLLIHDLVRREAGPRILAAIIEGERKPGRDEYEVLLETQVLLQELCDHDLISAQVLMAHLYPIANNLFFHDINDWINITIGQDPSDQLRERLRVLILQEKDEDLRKLFTEWMQ